MNQDIFQVATNIAIWLTPFTPYLISAAKIGGKKFVEIIAQKGGEATWDKAQEIWQKLVEEFGNGDKIRGAALMLSTDTEDQDSQKILAKAIFDKLQSAPEFALQLLDDLYKNESFQKVTASNYSLISDVEQEMTAGGKQIIEANNRSIVKGVKQQAKHK